MAKIPRYQQGNLASSMVGTPGIDTSMSSALQTGARAADNVADSLYNVAAYEWQLGKQEEARIRAEQREAQKQLTNMAYQNQAGADRAGYDTAMNSADNDLRLKHEFNTDGAMQAWQQKSDELINDRLENITDPKQKLMTQGVLQTAQAAKQQQFNDWILAQQHPIAVANVAKVADTLKLAVNDASLSTEEVLQKLDNYKNDDLTSTMYMNAYGPAAEAKIRQDQSEAARNYMSLIANAGGSERVKELINDKRFDSIIEGSDKEQFYSRQRSIAAEERRVVQHQEVITQQTAAVDTLVSLSNQSSDGNIYHAPPAAIQQAINDPNVPAGLKSRLAAQQGQARVQQVKVTNDNATLKNFGTYVQKSNALHDRIIQRWSDMYDSSGQRFKMHGPQLTDQFKLIQRDIDQYMSTYEDVKKVAGSVQTPDGKRAVQNYTLTADRDIQFMRSYLAKQPKAIQMKAARDSFNQAIGAPDIKYSNPQQQQIYNFHFRQVQNSAWDNLTNNGATTLNAKQAKALRLRIQQYAAKQAETQGFK